MLNLLNFFEAQMPNMDQFWTILVWVVIGLALVAAVVFAVVVIIKVAKLPKDERKTLIVQFLLGLVTYAESYFTGSGRGVEKLAWVEEQFNKRAPWFLKIVLMLLGKSTFAQLVDEALELAKNTLWDAAKEN